MLAAILVVRYSVFMTYMIPIGKRGNITLPQKAREEAGLAGSDHMIGEVTEQGILLRPASVVPVQIFSDEQLEQFRKDEEEVAKLLENYGIEKQNDFS